MKNKIFLSLLLLIALIFAGCQKMQKVQYDKQLPPGQLALRKITNPADIPDFTQGSYNLANLEMSIDRSISYMNKPSSKQFYPYGEISHQQALNSLKTFKNLIASGVKGPQLNAAIRDQFDVYESVGCDDHGTVLFTGYYTPILDGSPVATEKYKYPLYRQPDDLVKAPNGEILGRKGAAGQTTPYPARAEIESSDMLKGKELVWLANPFEAYIAHVQGSAKIRFPDGKLTTVGYAANNGHEYHGISQDMINDGKFTKEQLSLDSMINYFRQHPDEVSTYTAKNPRFVFFQKSDGSPRGCLNESVTAMRTIATDKSIYPRACPAFLITTLPVAFGASISQEQYSGFALDQDAGGAIRAPGRCDVYMGEGDMAGKLAGQTYREGRLYYIFVKPGIGQGPGLLPEPPGNN